MVKEDFREVKDYLPTGGKRRGRGLASSKRLIHYNSKNETRRMAKLLQRFLAGLDILGISV